MTTSSSGAITGATRVGNTAHIESVKSVDSSCCKIESISGKSELTIAMVNRPRRNAPSEASFVLKDCVTFGYCAAMINGVYIISEWWQLF